MFSYFEFLIAWRYLRSKRSEGGVTTMTWISLIGISLSVFALIATLSVRSGFRTELVDTILGANAHVTVYNQPMKDAEGNVYRSIKDYERLNTIISSLESVHRSAPLIRGQVMASANAITTGVDVFGISPANILSIRRVVDPETSSGNIKNFSKGLAIGSGVAQTLSVSVGDTIKLISPTGVKTAFGTSPRVKTFEVQYIFTAGRHDMDKIRIYMPFKIAQEYFDRANLADEIEVLVKNPEQIEKITEELSNVTNGNFLFWTWKDASSNYLRALEIEDNVMFIIMSILVLIATMNIISGLVMLVKNKGKDIAILRTIGLSETSVLRIFFICGAMTGIIGTIFGTLLGCLFAVYVDQIFSFINVISGGDVWDPTIRGIYSIPAELRWENILT
ncbi:MAG: ABC transporter permease, partial [Rhodobacteraceae bacterium]|nr:ABC transporter permease [Paracoccaceae bacterium]